MPSQQPEFTVLDLFSGIGGISLGLHWAGFRTRAFCEADPFARAVLARHWPGVLTYDDIRSLSAARLRSDGVPRPDLLCGGFPCQDVSLAGRGAGIAGGLGAGRSGLWSHMARLVRECRPRWVVVENVPGLRGRGADRVLDDLEAAGYAGWPLVVGAVHAGAPHRRSRMWLVAQAVAADGGGAGLETWQRAPAGTPPCLPVERRGGWAAEPGVRRVDDGVPAGVDGRGPFGPGCADPGWRGVGVSGTRAARIRVLGSAAVPTNAAMIGRSIFAAMA